MANDKERETLNMSRRVLIVEDDKEIRGLLKDYLTQNDYEVSEAVDGKVASNAINTDRFDVILMDMMLPYKPGDELIKELRARKDDANAAKTPVIVLSAKSGMDTRLDVLKSGADDYIIKPFNLDEVLVRIEVVLRRTGDGEYSDGETSENEEGEITFAGLTYSPSLNTVTYNGESLKLTAKEMHLLYLFLTNPNKTYTKANLYESVWEDTYYCEDNTINVHMSNLRNKLKKACGRELIETVWGIGYKLSQSED